MGAYAKLLQEGRTNEHPAPAPPATTTTSLSVPALLLLATFALTTTPSLPADRTARHLVATEPGTALALPAPIGFNT